MNVQSEKKRVTRFQSDEDRKKYFREKMRERRGPFRNHPYIMEDGRKYSEVHPKVKRTGKSVRCDLCLGTYWEVQHNHHLLTERHQHAVAIEKNIIQRLLQQKENCFSVSDNRGRKSLIKNNSSEEYIILNGESHSLIGDSPTIQSIVDQFRLNSVGLIAEHNGALIRADEFANHVLSTGDTLELIQFMGGG